MTHPMRISQVPWKSRLVESLKPDPETRNFTRWVEGSHFSKCHPTPVAKPALIGWSQTLASLLGLEKPSSNDDLDLMCLSGSSVAEGMQPHALRYGGHQFGHWAGQLGDGRAISLGEFQSDQLGWQEHQLKGAGPTPYSRRADGRAVLRSSLREFLCSEAMHGLGVPTTRALSVVRDMFYDGNPRPEPGAIVCRVAPSFLRFGNFEILAREGEVAECKMLYEFLVSHFPLEGVRVDDPLTYLEWITHRTAFMMAKWMSLGFVHGVMNTDNMSLLGLTIDYGPYGWLDEWDPAWTPNTTDAEGRRYCYGRQPEIALWNLSRLAESLLVLCPEQQVSVDRALAVLGQFSDVFQGFLESESLVKLGLRNKSTDGNNGNSGNKRSDAQDAFCVPTVLQSEKCNDEERKLLTQLHALFSEGKADMTLFFRGLSEMELATKSGFGEWFASVCYADLSDQTLEKAWEWFLSLRKEWEKNPLENRKDSMNSANPVFVPRNYIAHQAIVAAESGDLSVLEGLLLAAQNPFEANAWTSPWFQKRPAWATQQAGCSALSCSS